MKDPKATFRIPIESFKCCPSCNSTTLTEFADIHVLCSVCNWDSGESFVESGGMDALIYEYEKVLEAQALMQALQDARKEVA